MKNKVRSFLLITILICFGSLAHEFWIAPSAYMVKSNETFTMNCYAGEDFKQAIWANRKERTLSATHFFKNGSLDVTQDFIGQDAVSVPMHLQNSGNHLFAFRSKPSYIEMKGEAFNGYLKEDGITDILQYRIQNKLAANKSREFYQRCAKTLLQADGISDSTYAVNTGMPLEIIPLENPYQLKSDKINVYFEFKGKPLANYQVRTWCVKEGKLIVKSFYKTNDKGIAVLPVQASGEWMISVVKMVLYSDALKADYESFWGSYTFYKK
jgi:uncharacterized GH25 family protein